jgi:protein-disulfide isomerase
MENQSTETEIKTPEVYSQIQSSKLSIPVAIIFTGVLIAGAVFLSGGKSNNVQVNTQPQPQQAAPQTGNLEAMKAIASTDHIRGDPNAPVKIVEYSDTECPFCKRFHETMKEVMDEYDKDGKVAWVYRHFPLDQLHSKARKEAVALECANEQGGNDKFWSYVDRLYEITPANNALDPTELPKIAQYVGLDVEKFITCLGSTKYDAHIEEEVQNATATGGNGTPWSIVVGKNGKKYPLSGAQPLTAVKQLIEIALQEQ